MHTVGFVYVLSNDSMPDIVKVGMTTKLAEDRAKQLHSTGVPLPFEVEFRSATSHPNAVERRAHDLLKPYRVAQNREFFKVSPAEAIRAVSKALLDVAGIDAWTAGEPNFVKHGDRLALTLEAGQVFARLYYPELLSNAPVVADIWQAHADGDLLELMGTRSPGHVAGFSDGDPEGERDPVPYLDRAGTTPNGDVNGRERLAPGERLVWLAPIRGADACKVAFFEMKDYCQVISRTWDCKFRPNGMPFLLNDFTYDEPPPSFIRVLRGALRLPRPPSWAPPIPDPTEGWSPVADRPQPPDYWLPQLKPHPRPRRSDRP